MADGSVPLIVRAWYGSIGFLVILMEILHLTGTLEMNKLGEALFTGGFVKYPAVPATTEWMRLFMNATLGLGVVYLFSAITGNPHLVRPVMLAQFSWGLANFLAVCTGSMSMKWFMNWFLEMAVPSMFYLFVLPNVRNSALQQPLLKNALKRREVPLIVRAWYGCIGFVGVLMEILHLTGILDMNKLGETLFTGGLVQYPVPVPATTDWMRLFMNATLGLCVVYLMAAISGNPHLVRPVMLAQFSWGLANFLAVCTGAMSMKWFMNWFLEMAVPTMFYLFVLPTAAGKSS